MSPDAPENRPEQRAGTVALLGWTNVGKSTLLNRFAGDKVAAVANVPQTTRHRIRGVCNLEGRGQIVFVDTPGLHRPRSKMNRVMVETVRQTLRDVDLAALVVDAARGLGEGDHETAVWLGESGARCLAVLNKIDLVRPKSKLDGYVTLVGGSGPSNDSYTPMSTASPATLG